MDEYIKSPGQSILKSSIHFFYSGRKVSPFPKMYAVNKCKYVHIALRWSNYTYIFSQPPPSKQCVSS